MVDWSVMLYIQQILVKRWGYNVAGEIEGFMSRVMIVALGVAV